MHAQLSLSWWLSPCPGSLLHLGSPCFLKFFNSHDLYLVSQTVLYMYSVFTTYLILVTECKNKWMQHGWTCYISFSSEKKLSQHVSCFVSIQTFIVYYYTFYKLSCIATLAYISVFCSGEPFVDLFMNNTNLAVVSTFTYNPDLLIVSRQIPALCVFYCLILFHTWDILRVFKPWMFCMIASQDDLLQWNFSVITSTIEGRFCYNFTTVF